MCARDTRAPSRTHRGVTTARAVSLACVSSLCGCVNKLVSRSVWAVAREREFLKRDLVWDYTLQSLASVVPGLVQSPRIQVSAVSTHTRYFCFDALCLNWTLGPVWMHCGRRDIARHMLKVQFGSFYLQFNFKKNISKSAFLT